MYYQREPLAPAAPRPPAIYFSVAFPKYRGPLYINVLIRKGQCVVYSFSRTETGRAGPAELCSHIQRGDYIVGINGTSFEGLSLRERFQLLRRSTASVTLHMLRLVPPLHTKEGIRSARPVTQREAADELRQRMIKHDQTQTERQAAERAALRAIKAEPHSTRLSVGVVQSIMVAADSALETEDKLGFGAAVRLGLQDEDEDGEEGEESSKEKSLEDAGKNGSASEVKGATAQSKQTAPMDGVGGEAQTASEPPADPEPSAVTVPPSLPMQTGDSQGASSGSSSELLGCESQHPTAGATTNSTSEGAPAHTPAAGEAGLGTGATAATAGTDGNDQAADQDAPAPAPAPDASIDQARLQQALALLPDLALLTDEGRLQMAETRDGGVDSAHYEAGKGLHLPELAQARQWARSGGVDWVSAEAQAQWTAWLATWVKAHGLTMPLFFRKLALHASNGVKWIRGHLPHSCSSRMAVTCFHALHRMGALREATSDKVTGGMDALLELLRRTGAAEQRTVTVAEFVFDVPGANARLGGPWVPEGLLELPPGDSSPSSGSAAGSSDASPAPGVTLDRLREAFAAAGVASSASGGGGDKGGEEGDETPGGGSDGRSASGQRGSKRRRVERRAAASAASTIASTLAKKAPRPKRATRSYKPRAATVQRRSVKVPAKLLPGLTPMAYRALYDMGEPMPAIGPISAAMAAASHQFNKQQDRIRRRFGNSARGREAGVAQGLLASSGLGSGSAPRAQVVRGIVRSFRSSEAVKKKEPRLGDRYQSDLPAYYGSRTPAGYVGGRSAAAGSSLASSPSAGQSSQPVRFSFVPTAGRAVLDDSSGEEEEEASLLARATEVVPDLAEDPLEGVSDDEEEGQQRGRGGEMVWDPAAAAAAGLVDPVTDLCPQLETFVEQYQPHARERAFRALHECRYSPERAGTRMAGRRSWLGERAENEWRTWRVAEAASFWVAVEKHGKDFMAVCEEVAKAALRQARDDARQLMGLPPRLPPGGSAAASKRKLLASSSEPADEPDPLDVVEAKAQSLLKARRHRSLNACIGFFYAWWKAHPEYTHWKERRREEIFTNLEFHDEACGVCAAGGDLLCCDYCNKAYHLSCVGLTDADVNMDAEWCCPTCCEVLDTPLARVRAKAFVRAESLRLQLVQKRHLHRKAALQRKTVRLVAESVRCGGMLGYDASEMVGPAAKEAAGLVGAPTAAVFPSQARAVGWAMQLLTQGQPAGVVDAEDAKGCGWKGTGGRGTRSAGTEGDSGSRGGGGGDKEQDEDDEDEDDEEEESDGDWDAPSTRRGRRGRKRGKRSKGRRGKAKSSAEQAASQKKGTGADGSEPMDGGEGDGDATKAGAAASEKLAQAGIARRSIPPEWVHSKALWMSKARQEARAILARSGLLGHDDSLGPAISAAQERARAEKVAQEDGEAAGAPSSSSSTLVGTASPRSSTPPASHEPMTEAQIDALFNGEPTPAGSLLVREQWPPVMESRPHYGYEMEFVVPPASAGLPAFLHVPPGLSEAQLQAFVDGTATALLKQAQAEGGEADQATGQMIRSQLLNLARSNAPAYATYVQTFATALRGT